jgi:hypothetical protein
MSFRDLKSKNTLEHLTAEMEKVTKKTSESYKDDRFWRPELDKSSNGYAVIRFLPPSANEDVPWARLWSHGFQGPGGWYIENSRTTLSEKDPVSELNTKLWNSGTESDKEIARNRKRRLSYISNILIISDPANPQNEGKVFLYKYGKKIFDKVCEAMQPEFQDETPIVPFDFWKGADFKLKVRKVAGFINYDKSEFALPTALFDEDDSRLEELWNKQYSLSEFSDPSNFKSYEELTNRLAVVLGDDIRSAAPAKVPTAEDVEGAISAQTAFGSTNTNTTNTASDDNSEGTDALSYFEKLASED